MVGLFGAIMSSASLLFFGYSKKFSRDYCNVLGTKD